MMLFVVLSLLAQCLLISVSAENISVMIYLMITRKLIYDPVLTQYSANH